MPWSVASPSCSLTSIILDSFCSGLVQSVWSIMYAVQVLPSFICRRPSAEWTFGYWYVHLSVASSFPILVSKLLLLLSARLRSRIFAVLCCPISLIMYFSSSLTAQSVRRSGQFASIWYMHSSAVLSSASLSMALLRLVLSMVHSCAQS